MNTVNTVNTVDTVVLGAGPVGLVTAMLLARDGHRVVVLDKDAGQPEGGAERAWDEWRRPGVNQFRHPHILLPQAFRILARELPEALAELTFSGGRPHNMIAGTWNVPAVGGRQPGDERFGTVAARRPVIEAALGTVAARTPGVTVRRGTEAAVLMSGLERISGRPNVTGVLTRDGEVIGADLVVDAGGRNSPVTRMLVDIGAAKPVEKHQETGFLAYTRYFRSTDGTLPAQAPWPLYHHDSISVTTVPADAGTWAVILYVSSRDRALRALHDATVWQRAAALFPDVAHWAEHGQPITGVLAMSGAESKYRRFVVDGRPVATGLLSVGDAWATTNSKFALGMSMGMTHAVLLRDLLRAVGADEPEKLALRFDELTNTTLAPIHQAVAGWDRHRLAQIDGSISGIPYQTDDADWNFRRALEATKLSGPDIMRALADVGCMLATPEDAFGKPGLTDRVVALAGDTPSYPQAGPTRAELLATIGAM